MVYEDLNSNIADGQAVHQYRLGRSLVNPYCMLVIAEYAVCACWIGAAAILGVWHAGESIALLLFLGTIVLMLTTTTVLLAGHHILQRWLARSSGYMVIADSDTLRLQFRGIAIAFKPSDLEDVSLIRNRANVLVGIGLRFRGQRLEQNEDDGREAILQNMRAMRDRYGFDFILTLGLFQNRREFTAFLSHLIDLLSSDVGVREIEVPKRLIPKFLVMEPGPRWWRLLNWMFGVLLLCAFAYAIIELVI